jgi:hypothetical protein
VSITEVAVELPKVSVIKQRKFCREIFPSPQPVLDLLIIVAASLKAEERDVRFSFNPMF